MTLDEYKREYFRNRLSEDELFEAMHGISSGAAETLVNEITCVPEGYPTISESLRAKVSDPDMNSPGKSRINTFPYGTPTKIMTGTLLAVCAADRAVAGRKLFRDCLKHIVTYGARCRAGNSNGSVIDIVMLTDRWLPEVFAKYERALLELVGAAGIRCNLAFLLFTDYGVSRVPFIARRHQRDGLKEVDLSEPEDIQMISKRLGRVKLTIMPWRGWKTTEPDIEYDLDFKRAMCIKMERCVDSTSNSREISLSVDQIRRFAQGVYDLKAFGQDEDFCGVDCARYSFEAMNSNWSGALPSSIGGRITELFIQMLGNNY